MRTPAPATSRSHRQVPTVLWVTAAVVVAVSWHLELMLVVVATPAAAISLMAQELLVERMDGRRVAALALTAPDGRSDISALERIVAADLAAASLGDPAVLDTTAALASKTVDDAWSRALVGERVEAAKGFLMDTPLGARPRLRVLSTKPAVPAAVATLVACLAGVVATGHKALLLPIVLAVASLSAALAEHRRLAALSRLLLGEALTEPARGCIVMPESAVVDATRAMTAGRTRVRRVAHAIAAAWPEPERSTGIRRLTTETKEPRRLSSLDRAVIAGAVVAVTLTVALEIT